MSDFNDCLCYCCFILIVSITVSPVTPFIFLYEKFLSFAGPQLKNNIFLISLTWINKGEMKSNNLFTCLLVIFSTQEISLKHVFIFKVTPDYERRNQKLNGNWIHS